MDSQEAVVEENLTLRAMSRTTLRRVGGEREEQQLVIVRLALEEAIERLSKLGSRRRGAEEENQEGCQVDNGSSSLISRRASRPRNGLSWTFRGAFLMCRRLPLAYMAS